MADAYARACFVVAAIDLPLHGITRHRRARSIARPAKPQCIGATERTFDVDIVNNTTGAAGPDGMIDPSGGMNGLTYFNFFDPLAFRDNLRQGEADLIKLTKSIAGLAIATPTGPSRSASMPSQISFTGQSLGAIVGGAHVHFVERTYAPRSWRIRAARSRWSLDETRSLRRSRQGSWSALGRLRIAITTS